MPKSTWSRRKNHGKNNESGKVKKLSMKQVNKDRRNKLRTNIPICFDNDVNIRDNQVIKKAELVEGGFGWYRVMVSFGNKYNRYLLLQQLSTRCQPLEFTIYACQTVGTTLSFHVDNFKLADRLRSLSREITMPDSRRLEIRVYSGIPKVELTNSLKETLKNVLTRRYDAVHKFLNLEKLHGDPSFGDGQFCALFNPQVCEEVFRLISENIPDLRALNLSSNYLNGFNRLAKYLKMMHSLAIVDVSNNRINNIYELNSLKKLPIVDFVLCGNPIEKRFEHNSMSYKSEVRKILPKLMRLDRVELPPNMTFELDSIDTLNFPSSQPKFIAFPDAEATVKQFLEQYFQIYDSDNRQPLLDAYHNDCYFSISISYINDTPNNQPSLRDYHMVNRNLMRFTDPNRRQKSLKSSKLQTVALLNDLPKTKHDMASFTVDLTICTPAFFHLAVNGIFKEVVSDVCRYFSKTMIIVPCGSGVCIVNEMLHVTNPSKELIKNAFVSTAAVGQNQNQRSTNEFAAQQTVSPAAVMNNTTNQEQSLRMQMVQSISEQTKMNLRWSEMCLNETNWDLNKALFAFSESMKNNAIPSEAFVKE